MSAGLALEAVAVRAGARLLLADVSLAVGPAELIVLVGPNGAGKTTLLRTALGMERLAAGSVTIGGQPVRRLASRARAAAVAWLPQDPMPADALTALEVVTAARYRFDEPVRHSQSAARAALEQVAADRYAHRPLRELSGGERQRVALAVALAQEAPLLLLDEPANHLDPSHQRDLYELIGTLWRQGRGILCVTHDLNLVRFAARGSDIAAIQVVGLRDGRVRFRRPLAAATLPRDLGELFGVAFTALEVDGERLMLLTGNPRP